MASHLHDDDCTHPQCPIYQRLSASDEAREKFYDVLINSGNHDDAWIIAFDAGAAYRAAQARSERPALPLRARGGGS